MLMMMYVKSFLWKVLDCGGIWTQYLFCDAVVLAQDALDYQLCPQWCHAYRLVWTYRTGFQHCWFTIGCQSNSQSNSCTGSFTNPRQNSFVPTTSPWKRNGPFMVFLGFSSWRCRTFFFGGMYYVVVAIQGTLLFHSDPWRVPWSTEGVEYDLFKHVSLWVCPPSS